VRILVLQESDWIERGPHQSHHLLERLCERGHFVRVMDFEIGWRERRTTELFSARKEFVALPKVIEGSGIEVVRPALIRLPIVDYISSFVTHALEIGGQLGSWTPDIIVGLGLLNAFSGIRLARRAGIPFVYYVIDELHRLVPQAVFRDVARVVEQSNMRSASLVLSINNALRDYTIGMGAPPEKAKVLPAGVDIQRFRSFGGGSEIRERHGFRHTDLVLFFMGWVYPFSGLREVAESLMGGGGREAGARLLVVGKGDSWDEIARLAKVRGATDLIKMVDFRPYAEIPSYLSAADVCLLPALDTGTMRNIVPIKMYEYLAAGKPVIATRLSGLLREFGEHHGVVYVDSPSEVVAKATKLAREGSLQRIGEQGRAFVSGNDWRSITDAFEVLLTKLVDGRGARFRG